MSIAGEAFVEIHPDTAAECGIEDGEYVRIESRHGSARVLAQITNRVGLETVFVPMHYLNDAQVNLLTNEESLDPDAHCPEYKATPVRVEPETTGDRTPASASSGGQSATPADFELPEVEPLPRPGTEDSTTEAND